MFIIETRPRRFLVLLLSMLTIGATPIKHSKKELWGEKKILLKELLQIGKESIEDENYFFGIIEDILVDPVGNIYILDNSNFRVLKYSSKGEFLLKFGKRGQGPAEFIEPRQLAMNRQGQIYVSDTRASRISIFTNQGVFLKSIKTGPLPAIIDVNSKKHLYLNQMMDSSDKLISQIDDNGVLVRRFRDSSKVDKSVFRAGGIGQLLVDNHDRIYYSSYYPYLIELFDTEGRFLSGFSREIKGLKEPYLDKMKVMTCQSGSLGLFLLPGAKVCNVVRIKEAEDKWQFYFDIFSNNGDWLITFTADALKSKWIRKIVSDREGNIYVDYTDPYPHIKKFSLRFE